jgi:butyryl-CoA dehydrogenase
VKEWVKVLKGLDQDLSKSANADIQSLRNHLSVAVKAVEDSVAFILGAASKDPNAAFAGAVPFLKLMGITAGGWQLARSALISEKHLNEKAGDEGFYKAKISTARFFGDHVLSQAPGLAATVTSGSAAVMALSDDQFLAA